MIGRLKDMAKTRDGKWVVSFTTPEDFSEGFDDLKDKDIEVIIKKWGKRRSLDANAYAWVLINQIAAKLQEKEPKNGWTPLEVYRAAVREVAGACKVHMVPVDDADEIFKDWTDMGMGFQVEPLGISDGWIETLFWKGSHLFTSQQMSVLINILIQEANQQGIPTMPDDEARKMIGDWAVKRKENENVSADEGASVPA